MKKSIRIAALMLAVMFIVSGMITTALAAPATDDEAGYNITFTVTGEGSVMLYKTTGSVFMQEIKGGETVTITVTHSIKFTTNPSDSNIQRYVTCNDPNRMAVGDYYYINPSRDSQVTVKIPEGGNSSSNPEDPSSKPESSDTSNDNGNGNGTPRTIMLDVGFGGKVTIANENIIVSNQKRNFLKYDGDNMEFVITADAGYEIQSLVVGDEEVPAQGSSYTYYLNNISESTSVTVTFRSLNGEVNTNEISVTDINWESENISINVSGGKKVKREVLTRISALNPTAGKYVEFVSENGIIYIPYGGMFVGMSAVADMSVSKIDSGADFDTVKNFFANGEQFALFGVSTAGNLLPADSLIAFKVGAGFANQPVNLHSVNGTSITLNQNGNAVVSADGFTQKFVYSNEPVLACISAAASKVTVEIVLPPAGGNATPAGANLVNKGEGFNYTVNSAPGFVIKQITLNGVALEGVAGQSVYKGEFVAETDCTIAIEFEAVVAEEESESNAGTVIVVLVIVIVALLGAAALFVVKWRQEKF